MPDRKQAPTKDYLGMIQGDRRAELLNRLDAEHKDREHTFVSDGITAHELARQGLTRVEGPDGRWHNDLVAWLPKEDAVGIKVALEQQSAEMVTSLYVRPGDKVMGKNAPGNLIPKAKQPPVHTQPKESRAAG